MVPTDIQVKGIPDGKNSLTVIIWKNNLNFTQKVR